MSPEGAGRPWQRHWRGLQGLDQVPASVPSSPLVLCFEVLSKAGCFCLWLSGPRGRWVGLGHSTFWGEGVYTRCCLLPRANRGIYTTPPAGAGMGPRARGCQQGCGLTVRRCPCLPVPPAPTGLVRRWSLTPWRAGWFCCSLPTPWACGLPSQPLSPPPRRRWAVPAERWGWGAPRQAAQFRAGSGAGPKVELSLG